MVLGISKLKSGWIRNINLFDICNPSRLEKPLKAIPASSIRSEKSLENYDIRRRIIMAEQAPVAPVSPDPSAPAPATNVPADTETPSQHQFNWRNALRWLLGIIVVFIVAFLLFAGIVWGIRKVSQMLQPVAQQPVVEQPIVVQQPAVLTYACNTVAIGTPVTKDGECRFCTVNYAKPGPVYIAGENPISYTSGAYVFQYTVGDLQGFNLCIKGQPFYTDSQYEPVWK